MFKSIPRVVALFLVGYLICSPLVAVANTAATNSPKTNVAERPNLPSTQQTAQATKSDTKASNVLPKRGSKARVNTKDSLSIKKVRVSKKWAHAKTVRLSPKTKALGDSEDCNACHLQCLAGSLTCIAASIVTGCLPCGGICLAGQLACGLICNGTTACKNAVAAESPPIN